MFNLSGFHERFHGPSAMTAHRIYRIAFAACMGVLLLGWAAPGHAAEPALPGADTPYGSGSASALTGGKTPGPLITKRDSTLDPKQCGQKKDRLIAISKRFDEIDKVQVPLHKALEEGAA